VSGSRKSRWDRKGGAITSHIALRRGYVVYMPTLEHMGVFARKI
jgi:Ribonuclease G/E